jgi:hypothetical protein
MVICHRSTRQRKPSETHIVLRHVLSDNFVGQEVSFNHALDSERLEFLKVPSHPSQRTVLRPKQVPHGLFLDNTVMS